MNAILLKMGQKRDPKLAKGIAEIDRLKDY